MNIFAFSTANKGTPAIVYIPNLSYLQYMRIRTILPWIYSLSIAALGLSLYAKATESGNQVTLFMVSLILQFVFAVFAVYELRGSEHFTKREKADWSLLILCAPLIFGTAYFVKLRRRIFHI
ncbi:MAG: hypothetical protein ABI581_04815 [Sediminibacterium sp.]